MQAQKYEIYIPKFGKELQILHHIEQMPLYANEPIDSHRQNIPTGCYIVY